MAITVTQKPSLPFDMAYGANPFTLDGITPSQDKYALRIYIVGNVDPVADIRQSPNRFAKAIFDIQNILQSIVGPSDYNIDNVGVGQQRPMHIANGELIQYQIGLNTETNGTLDGPWLIQPTIYTSIAGSKQYYDVPFNASKYQPKIQGDINGCTILNPASKSPQGFALSDNTWTISDTATGDDFYAEQWRSPQGIDMHNVYSDSVCTKSFYNVTSKTGPIPPVFTAQGIELFLVVQFDANGLLISETEVDNIQSNGGGPNVTPGQGLVPTGNFQTITFGCGPANIPEVNINSLTKTYYVMPMVFSPTSAACGNSGVMQPSGWKTQGFRILDEECNDYSHIQFAWLNSLGFRDQFTFTKRNEKKINTKRNEYLKEAADYNSNSYSVDEQSRGFTTYSQTIKETWSAETGFINDEEAKLLESMFKSAQVNVRFTDGEYLNQWVPVRLQSSSYVEKTYRKDRLFQYTVNFTLASNIKSQRG